MPSHIENRETIIERLREEMIGPAPRGDSLDCTKTLVFATRQEAYQPFKQAASSEEILQRDAPLNRYGAGVLYPYGKTESEIFDQNENQQQTTALPLEDEKSLKNEALTEQAEKSIAEFADDTPVFDEDTDFDLSAANKYLPSSIGLSFLVELPENARLVVTASAGRYRKLPVKIVDQDRVWWRRETIEIAAEFDANQFRDSKIGKIAHARIEKKNVDGLDLQIEVFSRQRGAEDDCRLLTVCLINRTTTEKLSRDEAAIFQTRFAVRVAAENSNQHILPYPQAEYTRRDQEEDSNALLYRNVQTFAVGHGCAADWQNISSDASRVESVSAECLPVTEVPPITPDVQKSDGTKLEISMAKLGGLFAGENGFDDLQILVDEYEKWINRRAAEIENLPPKHRSAAHLHLAKCRKCALRMRDGLQFLQSNEKARLAFELANHAVLIQQYRSKSDLRRLHYDPKKVRMEFDQPPQKIDLTDGKLGKWRAFQIAFLLMSLRSAVEPDAPDRETVELIWFPTGGGKTEAYLGLTAFALFMRRLNDPNDVGTQVLMRYTLRLLTAQQFQRACSLICAMESLRQTRTAQLGAQAFTIALWVGNTVTPGTRQQARETLRALQRGSNAAENLFILSRCPWCAAQIGELEVKANVRNAPRVAGYEEADGTVVFKCSDKQNCAFADGLPIFVTDEDIYAARPSVVIGTVDKFAMLAWKPEARAIFGFDSEGKRAVSPPGLVIQDELHLISGPLGSIVGLYEAVIEELCTDRRNDEVVRPKIISSTATTRAYKEQIRALYARTEVQLFPPPGLDVSDSFFARYAVDETGKLLPGRKFVGINAPGLGSLQNAEVRVYTALMQAPFEFTDEERDPWWTLLVFFNNLRMLGNTISLFQANVPAYVETFKNRTRQQKIRRLDQPLELTGRLRNDEVPAALTKLEVKTTDAHKKPVDVCLASNIIEVGVDIDRLSLMCVIGQPKTTAQYIQVTGRVGRRWWERPGVVVTIYSPSKPRDRSHYEHFRSYHEQLYAQVEPTSVTPFSQPALERALHAAIVAFVRQTGTSEQSAGPYPFPKEPLENLREILRPRVATVDAAELATFERLFDRRINEWTLWQRTRWGGVMDTDLQDALLRTAGVWARPEDRLVSWSTPTSMRNVDAQGEIKVTNLYNLAALENAEEEQA